ncbi:hypothetical protein BJY52DRAFT_1280640, partial [Lactarius psammicola]
MLVPGAVLTAIGATALDLRLLQRSTSSDAQNEREKGHGNQDAHFAQVVVRSRYCRGDSKERLLGCGDAGLKHRGNACFISRKGSKKNADMTKVGVP